MNENIDLTEILKDVLKELSCIVPFMERCNLNELLVLIYVLLK